METKHHVAQECLFNNLKQLQIIFFFFLEVLPLHFSLSTNLSDKLLVSLLCHPNAAQVEVYFKNVGAIWKRKTICFALAKIELNTVDKIKTRSRPAHACTFEFVLIGN